MATPRRPKPDAIFDVDLSDEARKSLADELSRHIEDDSSVRAPMIADGGLIDLFDWFYEQGRSAPQDRPFEGAADLTSYIITENVDALQARLMQAVFKAEPFCLVDGWGDAATRAPFVEAFHEWQVDEEGLEEELGKVTLGALLEPAQVLEVRERVETIKTQKTMDVAVEVDEAGRAVFKDGRPVLKRDPETGDYVPATQGEQFASIEVTGVKTKRLGPEYDVIGMKDFGFLPAHAKSQRQVWGYWKRLWLRVPELQARVKDKVYDAAAVALLGEQSDRETVDTPATVTDVAPQVGPAVEKELFELTLKRDLDGDGREEWYIATLSHKHRVLLRLKLDTFLMRHGLPRCVPFVLFPRRNSVYGYVYAEKLLTLAEEHTAVRNMVADRSALATNAPIKRKTTSLWDAEAQPFGVGAIIDVREMNELEPMVVPDVPESAIYKERDILQAKERVGGLADTAIGVQSSEKRTLGENRLVAGGSAVRVEYPLGFFRKSIAKVMQLRHVIWMDTLSKDDQGLEAPAQVVSRLQASGMPLQNGRFTVNQLKGRFAFKPYGSVDAADAGVRMQYFNQSAIALGNMAKMFPPLAGIFANPDVMLRFLQEWGRVYKIRDVNVFVRAFQQAQQAGPPGLGLPPGAPPLGMPPAAGGAMPDMAGLLQALTAGGAPEEELEAGGY